MDGSGESGRVVQPAVIEGRSMAVLYGSETGGAEDIAGELGKTAERLHFQTTVDEMDSFKLGDLLRMSLVVFVTSTTGQGDMPKNTLKFWKNLRREKLNNTNCLRSLRFTIFGLGDSSYPKFNWAARKLRARLLQLGATEFFRHGEGDERHDNGIDSIYLPWYEELKKTLLANYPLPQSITPIPDDAQLPPRYPIELLSTMNAGKTGVEHDETAKAPPSTDEERRFLATRTKSAARSHVDHPQSAAEQTQEDWVRLKTTFPADEARRDAVYERDNPRAFDLLDKNNRLKDYPEKYLLERQPPQIFDSPPQSVLPIPDTCLATLVQNDRVTPADHWQDVRHLALDLDLEERDWKRLAQSIGSFTLVIWPKNYPEDVDELISLMGWEAAADIPLQFAAVPRGVYVWNGVTPLRRLLSHNLDITAVPKRSFIRELIHFTKDPREQERLMELVEPGNEQEFYDYTCRPRRTILELLRDFAGVKIPYNRVFDLFPVIRGREFSVCNGGESLNEVKHEFHFKIEILVALVEYKTIIRKPRQGLCSRYLKHLPPGTKLGVRLKPSSANLVPNQAAAKRPLIAIGTGTGVAPIRAVIQERDSFDSSGDTLLFFGCRNRDADFHFAREWASYPNVKVYPAFSRDRIEPDPGTATGPTTAPSIVSTPGDPLAAAVEALYPVQYDAHKNYVQHLIRKHAAEVGALLRRNPIVMICGNAGRMPTSVRNALMDVLVLTNMCPNKEAAERWLGNPDNLTLWQETW
ncbi:hypothetical protein C7999DRAFT_42110 [Corynascus novoguineensis]|uniref:NADPH-dependent diflavin oxidoreductase 1 n=1 Tax=Corynascus novoguineensis TaxID=1126955 RepID=A0AAN7CQE5_9PEZI|nr:hypothetical protein C7999DRAFT_42110 [Corynascus novoguineensis]